MHSERPEHKCFLKLNRTTVIASGMMQLWKKNKKKQKKPNPPTIRIKQGCFSYVYTSMKCFLSKFYKCNYFHFEKPSPTKFNAIRKSFFFKLFLITVVLG